MKHFSFLRLQSGLSETALAEKAGLSRLTLRQIESQKGNPTLHSLEQVASALHRKLECILLPLSDCDADYCSVAISTKVIVDGFDSWVIHFMELVDEFRKFCDIRLVLLPPSKDLCFSLTALLASIVLALCEEAKLNSPDWSQRIYYLKKPWFLSETESLKAMAIRESPWAFRRNNIFVLENFLVRT